MNKFLKIFCFVLSKVSLFLCGSFIALIVEFGFDITLCCGLIVMIFGVIIGKLVPNIIEQRENEI